MHVPHINDNVTTTITINAQNRCAGDSHRGFWCEIVKEIAETREMDVLENDRVVCETIVGVCM